MGLPEQRLWVTSYALTGVFGALAGRSGGPILLDFLRDAPHLNFYRFVPMALCLCGVTPAITVRAGLPLVIEGTAPLPGRLWPTTCCSRLPPAARQAPGPD